MFLKNVFNFQSNKSSTIAPSIALIFVIMVFSGGALADDKLTHEIRTRTLDTVISATQYVMKEFRVRGSSLERNIEKKLQLD